MTRVVQHREQAGAQEAFEDWERRLQSSDYLEARLSTRPGAVFERFEQLPVAPVGDRSLAVDAIINIQVPQGETSFITRFYLFQQGPIMGLLEVFYVQEAAPYEEFEGLVRDFHTRVLAGLGEP